MSWQERLWPHQREALRRIRRYLTASPAVDGSALIRMPTGTGKSGVIAVTAHTLGTRGHVLVLAPWDALVEQLVRDIAQRFWMRIGTKAPSAKPTVRLLPSNADAALRDARDTRTIFVATIATLEDLRAAEDLTVYRRLAQAVGTVLVDEGHREPAPSWSRAVRELRRPTVLFTATPYRNDLQLFRVHPDHYHSYSHQQAETDRFIRQVAFEPMQLKGAESFARELMRFCERTFGRRDQPRVIVRCETQERVKAVTAALNKLGATALGVHDRFAMSEGPLRHDVPDADRTDLPQYWVHQYKLIEGIDSPTFRVLAIYDAMRNDRAFVQQVGRILRNPSRSASEQAWVVSDPDERLAEAWDVYRTYDRDPRTSTYDALATSSDLVRAQPLRYVLRRFRAPFVLEAPDAHEEFNYPRATQVFLVGAAFKIDDFASAVEEEWSGADRVLGGIREPDAHTRVHPYVALQNSPLLLRTAFTEETLGVTIYRRVRGYLFYYDTQGRIPEALDGVGRVAPGVLERLYRGRSARLASVTLRNTSVGRYDVRRRTLQAYAVDDLAPDLSDHAQYASTATGFTDDADLPTTQRYVGFANARVRDRGGRPTPFADYVAWVERVATELDTQGRTLRVFNRYAEVVPPPADPRAANILLDFDQALYKESPPADGGAGRALQIADLCLAVDGQGNFTCTANEREYQLNVQWQTATSTYKLSGQRLDDDYLSQATERRPRSPLAHLNQRQAFRIIPRQAQLLHYSHGRFYKPRVPLWGTMAGRLELLSILEPIPALAAMTHEKGEAVRAGGAGWEHGSLFHLIDSRGAGTPLRAHMEHEDLLVCDDMGTEIADFITLDTHGRRVAGIHAKAFNPARQLSASALQEIGMQALKNLGSFQPFTTGTPANVQRWGGPWTHPTIGTVTRRLRRGEGTGVQVWLRIRDALRDPLVTREIWLVLGAALSKQALTASQSSNNPTPETIQLLYALQSVWSSVQATGARLRVFCSP
jgi:superfamily II DNA or RNA helicase